jgi:hypothetical protein
MLSTSTAMNFDHYSIPPTWEKVKVIMRVSEGVPNGRIAELYNPGLFQKHEEVIVFEREGFKRTYNSIREQIEYINKIAVHLDEGEDWKLLGYWPKILERIHILDINMNLMFKEEPVQCYLDTYLHNAVRSSKNHVAVSARKVPIQSKLLI